MAQIDAGLCEIPGGFFEMGTNKPRYTVDLDGPARRVKVSGFRIGRLAVTNALFARFIAESGYRTTAEREGWSYVFAPFLEDAARHCDFAAGTPWWRRVDGADWAHPEGPQSTIDARLDHPVVHVSWLDAQAFARFTGTRLPSEAQWEYAARGGLKGKRHPWGNQLVPASGHQQNVWQGHFPDQNLAEDGYAGTAPADHFAPNGYGLYNMTGNVWEWCQDGFGPLPASLKGRPPLDPVGAITSDERVTRGGSHLCHASYCERYYVHSRTPNTADSTTGHTGFRIAARGST